MSEALGQDPIFEEGVELVSDELRLVGADGSLDVGEEGLGVLVYLTAPHSLLGAATFVVNRGIIGLALGR